MAKKLSPVSLEKLCCQAVSENTSLYTCEAFSGLNLPCLKLLAYSFSLHDVLIFESFFKERGIDTSLVLNTLQHLCFYNGTAYPMRSNNLPHLLRFSSEFGWDSALSRLLYKRLFVPVLDEYGTVVRKGRESMDYLKEALYKYKDLQKLFVPRYRLKEFREIPLPRRGEFSTVTHDSIINFCAVAALKILTVVMDANFCDFIGDSTNSPVFTSLCESLKTVSLIIRSDKLFLYILEYLLRHAKVLNRVSLYCLKEEDMRYFDETVSRVSGVSGYFDSNLASNKRMRMDAKSFRYVYPNNVLCFKGQGLSGVYWDKKDEEDTIMTDMEDEEPFIAPTDPESGAAENDDHEDDDVLMDDAILAVVQPLPSQDDSFDGVSQFIFKATNLVRPEAYTSVLEHHFRHWLSLTHLDFQVPKLSRRMGECLCSLIERQSFKSLTLTSAEVCYDVIEDILCCVACSRKRVPMDELFLVDLHEPVNVREDDWMKPENDADAKALFALVKSDRLRLSGRFQGTKSFEIGDSKFNMKTQCLIRQYLLADAALEKLFLHGSLKNIVLRSVLKGLTRFDSHISHFLLEDHCLSSQKDCTALTRFLESVSVTLIALTLRSSFCFRDREAFIATSIVIAKCQNLKYLDLGKNHALAKNMMPFCSIFFDGSRKLKELSLRGNSIPYADILEILRLLAEQTTSNRPTLDILDIRGNAFVSNESERQKWAELITSAARWFICEELMPARG